MTTSERIALLAVFIVAMAAVFAIPVIQKHIAESKKVTAEYERESKSNSALPVLLGDCVRVDGSATDCSAKQVTQRASDYQADCVTVEILTVDRAFNVYGPGWQTAWHFRMHNSCKVATTGRVYVRLAFYDGNGYRNGFASFALEPMQPGERVRVDALVPRRDDETARVFAMTTDSAVALQWL